MSGNTPAAPRDAGAPPEPGTLFAGKRLFWLVMEPMVLLDLWSKAWVFGLLAESNGGHFNLRSEHRVFHTRLVSFDLVNYFNPGTIWGMFQDYNQPLRYLRLVAIGVILWFVYRTPRAATFTKLALGLIMAGALGNLYDNFLHQLDPAVYSSKQIAEFSGAVRDFLHFHRVPNWDFPAFNVADSCITVGASTLFLILLGHRDPQPGNKA
ncbi:MAG: signal peptidase II [Planctomycetes bacterium]|nr:signal peptidase II [Planctomycetota bacterium]